MNNVLDIVLSTIVNNDKLLNDIILEVDKRFKVKLDKERLEAYLASFETESQNHVLML